MIVQTAPEGAPRLVICMAEHTALSDQLAEAFGNGDFEAVTDPATRFITANNDAGWADLDNAFRIDPATDYPYNLTEIPFEMIMGTSRGSPDVNEAHDAFLGLLSNMQSWELYNGPFGLSDIVVLDKFAEQYVPAGETMLAHEEARQDRLKETLPTAPETRDKVSEDRLMQAYKQLQFFDTLAPYFKRAHEGARDEPVFPHVPKPATADEDVTVTPVAERQYRVSPCQCAGEHFTVAFEGRYMQPAAGPADPAGLPMTTQSVTLIAD